MSWRLETVSSAPAFLRKSGAFNPMLHSLDFFQCEFDFGTSTASDHPDLRFLYDVVLRILHRGTGALPNLCVERILATYGQEFALREKPDDAAGCIEWQSDHEAAAVLDHFTDYLTPWTGDAAMVAFDPNHPENERRLFQQLLDHYGTRLASCLYTQVHIPDILPVADSAPFQGQQVDFLLSFPNGRRLILEPGDHDSGPHPLAQRNRDNQRDAAFAKHGIRTLRIENRHIGTPAVIRDIDALLYECDAQPYLRDATETGQDNRRHNHLLLASHLVARIEHVLAFFFSPTRHAQV